MSGVRKIDPVTAGAPEDWRDRAGKPPYMAFIALGKLVVETRYQRVIGKQGLANVKKIVSDFRWSRFAPIIVAPLDGDTYAVIDGQHRVAALAALGEKSAPAIVHEIDYAQRADAFAALNISITALSAQARFFARLESGDAFAVKVAAIADRHGVTLMKYNIATAQMSGRQSAASAAMVRAVRRYGDEPLDLAIAVIVGHPDFQPGFLRSQFIAAMSTALYEDARLFKNRQRTIAAFASFDLEVEYEEALKVSKRVRGVSAQRQLASAIKVHLQARALGASAERVA